MCRGQQGGQSLYQLHQQVSAWCVCVCVKHGIIERFDLTVLSLVVENKDSSVCTMYSQPTGKRVPSGRSFREGQCLSTSPV